MKPFKTLLLAALMSAAMFAPVLSGCGGGTGGGTGGGSANTGGGTGSGGGGGSDAGTDCYAGTPTTNAQLLNACVPDSIEKVLKETSWRNAGVTLPALP